MTNGSAPINGGSGLVPPRPLGEIRRAGDEVDAGGFWGGVQRLGGVAAAGSGAVFVRLAESALDRAIGSVVGTSEIGSSGQTPESLFDKQLEAQRENLVWTFRTNIAKTEHETRMSSVRNIRP